MGLRDSRFAEGFNKLFSGWKLTNGAAHVSTFAEQVGSTTIHEISSPTSTVAGVTGVSYTRLTFSLDNINAMASDVVYVYVCWNAADATEAGTFLSTPGSRIIVKADAYPVTIGDADGTITNFYYKSAIASPTQAVVLTAVGG